MVNVTLDWTLRTEIGSRLMDIDYLLKQLAFPALPVVGQKILISRYELESGEEDGDYFTFEVEEIKFYVEKPGQPVEARVVVALKQCGKDQVAAKYESLACQVLMKFHQWTDEET